MLLCFQIRIHLSFDSIGAFPKAPISAALTKVLDNECIADVEGLAFPRAREPPVLRYPVLECRVAADILRRRFIRHEPEMAVVVLGPVWALDQDSIRI